jgi:hypothetical protein
MLVLIFVAAVASVLWSETLETGSFARDLLNTSWLLAPYLVLTAVMIAERRTSLLAIAIVTLFGAVGALTSVVVTTVVQGGVADRLLPIYQAGAIAALVPTCRWMIVRIDTKPRSGS